MEIDIPDFPDSWELSIRNHLHCSIILLMGPSLKNRAPNHTSWCVFLPYSSMPNGSCVVFSHKGRLRSNQSGSNKSLAADLKKIGVDIKTFFHKALSLSMDSYHLLF